MTLNSMMDVFPNLKVSGPVGCSLNAKYIQIEYILESSHGKGPSELPWWSDQVCGY